MIIKKSRNSQRRRRHSRARSYFAGTAERPRLCVYRANKHMYAQIIDDSSHTTLVSASTLETGIKAGLEGTADVAAAKAVGEALGRRALDKGITEVVFDRSGYIYHGRVAALAEGAREAGLKF
ncbi:MAG: 50S ribosomal protein L18 [Clostridiaceae bacterium]|nr:50S ribosomal protein L18 [Clostridiaceae bacterium]